MSHMSKMLAGLFFTVLPLAMTPANAQSQSEVAPTTEDGLALGETVDDTPQPGETYIKETFGDWAVRCVVERIGADRCQLYQLLKDEAGQPIVEYTLLKLPETAQAAAAATIVAPLETSLMEQMTIKIDEEPAKRYPFSFCNQIGCYARIALLDEDIAMYEKGSGGKISIVPFLAPDVTISVDLSLSGFTAAFEYLNDPASGN